MKLSLSDLKGALGACGQIASGSKDTGKWLLLVDPNELRFQGQESRVEAKLPNSTIASNESLLIELSVLKNLIGVCQDDIVLTLDPVDKTVAKIKSGKFLTKVAVKDASEFPTPFVPGTGSTSITVDRKALEASVKNVEFAIANSIDKNWKENFLKLTLSPTTNDITLIGCSDSVVALSKVDIANTFSRDLLLSREISTVLKCFTDKTIEIIDRGNTVVLRDKLLSIVTLPANVKAPNIAAILKAARSTNFVVEIKKFIDAINKIEVAKQNANSKSSLIDADITATSIKLKTLANSNYEAFIDLDITSNVPATDTIKVAFNGGRMLTALSRLEKDKATIQIADKKQFFCLEEDKKTYVLVLSTQESV